MPPVSSPSWGPWPLTSIMSSRVKGQERSWALWKQEQKVKPDTSWRLLEHFISLLVAVASFITYHCYDCWIRHTSPRSASEVFYLVVVTRMESWFCFKSILFLGGYSGAWGAGAVARNCMKSHQVLDLHTYVSKTDFFFIVSKNLTGTVVSSSSDLILSHFQGQ